MYLSEEKRAAIRACFDHQRSQSKEKKADHQRKLHATEDSRKVSQILFDARDGREVFTPF